MITPGMVIGDRYEIIEKIGSGGMADVYKSRCRKLNRLVAIKFLKPEYSSDNTFVTKFRGEAESCAGLTHPNIVSVYDVGDEGDLHYIVMELVEGITLKRYIEKKGQLDIKEAVGIAIQIAQGLEAAHAKKVIHRDIKPQNIILSREGKVKVADFGIAKAATTTNTIRETTIGSVHYLSPEQARGGYNDERSDIYSLGITMYEMLAGKVPYSGDNNVSIALLHINGVATPLSELNQNITPAVEKIVRKCMSKKPERRYSSAAELIRDLKASITNPSGEFVTMTAAVVTDSPTRHLSTDEVRQIKNGAKTTYFDEDDDGDDEDEDPKKAVVVRRSKSDDDDEDIDEVGGIWEKVALFASILLMLCVAVVVIMFLNKATGIFDKSNKGQTLNPTKKVTSTPSPTPVPKTEGMPNLVGQTLTQAEVKLKSLGLNLNITAPEDTQTNNNYPAGTITGQEPQYGAELSYGDTVVLHVSIGKGTFTIPPVKGKSLDQVKKMFSSNMEIVTIPESNDADENTVLRTEPGEGAKVEVGSSITIYYSIGPEPVSVPNVVGSSEAAAKLSLTKAGLNAETHTEYSDAPEGTVFNQLPGASEEVKKGSTISIFVSMGPEPTPDPTPTPTPTPDPTPTPTPEPTPDDDV